MAAFDVDVPPARNVAAAGAADFRATVGMRLRAAYLTMHRTFNSHFAQFGATADQYVLLRLLSEEDGIAQQELGRRMCSDANTVTAMLALLEKKGLVRRQAHARDGRARCVHLTAKGERLFRKLDDSAEGLHTRLDGCLANRRGELLWDLAQIAEALSDQRSTLSNHRKADR